MDLKLGKFKVAALVGLFAVATALGAWLVMDNTGFTATVTSTSELPLEFTSDLADGNVDTTDGPQVYETSAVLHNSDGDIPARLTYEIVKSDVSDGCTDYQNDCSLTLQLGNYGEFVNETEVTLQSGDSLLGANLSCVRFSCPQDVSVVVTVEEI